MRGDDVFFDEGTQFGDGSPPRAWGRFHQIDKRIRDTRFTPTCVGTMSITWATTSPSPVHPHVRGDDQSRSIMRRLTCGSPPRAWGRFQSSENEEQGFRFTPTCVGTIRDGGELSFTVKVHPHVRGDDDSDTFQTSVEQGSPPRAWGRSQQGNHGRTIRRFTPTCVGTISTVLDKLIKGKVHPHVRGDDAPTPTADHAARGSPPRAWGR